MFAFRPARFAPCFFFCAVLAVIATVRAQDLPAGGTWSLERLSTTTAQFAIRMHTATSDMEEDHSIPIASITGLSADALERSGTTHFQIVRDAGTLDCEGSLRNGNGGGTFAYIPSSRFVQELARRSLAAPTPLQQLQLTVGNVTLAYVDELRAAGFRPSTADLVRLMQHGVTADFVHEITAAGLHPSSIDDLVKVRDHGVTSQYVQGLTKAGFHLSSVDDAVRLRDHGVTVDYVNGLISRNLRPSAEECVRLMDHGVSLAYIDRLRAHGYHPSIDELIRLRDSGV